MRLIYFTFAMVVIAALGTGSDVTITSANGPVVVASTADIILTSEELAKQLGAVKPRVVTIYSIECVALEGDEIELEIHCSKGTTILRLRGF